MQERELCAAARLLPAHLLALKAGLLAAGAERGRLGRDDAASLLRLEPAHAARVHELLAAAGWLSASPAPAPGHGAVGFALPALESGAGAQGAPAAANGACEALRERVGGGGAPQPP